MFAHESFCIEQGCGESDNLLKIVHFLELNLFRQLFAPSSTVIFMKMFDQEPSAKDVVANSYCEGACGRRRKQPTTRIKYGEDDLTKF